jgi:hypothetical protein
MAPSAKIATPPKNVKINPGFKGAVITIPRSNNMSFNI